MDNSTISSLASLVTSIHMMGSNESRDPPPKPSVVFTTDKFKEFHGDQPPMVVSQMTSVPVPVSMSDHSKWVDGAGVVDTQDGVWLSPSRKHTVPAVTPTGGNQMDIDTENRYAVLESLGKTRSRSMDLVSKQPITNATNRHCLRRATWRRYWLMNPLQNHSSLDHLLQFRSTLQMVDEREGLLSIAVIDSAAAQMMASVTRVDPVVNSVTGGQGNNLGDSNSDL